MSIYILFVVVLFLLAVSDLMVGVANDAINFLNSAIGSKVAQKRTIMIVASLGIMGGALLSNGMMEVARKGLFNPQFFMFSEIIIIFLAVMFTDVLLLDLFNTFGLPTSTTVSLVFGLLGAAVGMALLKAGEQIVVIDGIEKVLQVGDYINSSKAFVIISSILLSVVFSFVFGVLIQWLSRLLFSFNTGKTIKYYGSLWGGLAISAITYFILIKGLKDASFMTKEAYSYIHNNTLIIIALSFAFWALFLQLISWIFKVNPLKVVVLFGTFALAMAFAGNDLVNFIGVPLAGFEAFKTYTANNSTDLLMGNLLGELHTSIYFLIAAGIIMVITLWFSKKALTVADTELKLSRQDEGSERFGSSVFSRFLVRRVINTGTFFSKVIPQPIINKIGNRFDKTEFEASLRNEKDPPMFDLVRASVNMMVASILIAVGTSFKLPLSTTYVTFMVAMSTSLVDGAWGRDSAVYRITGVFTVIGGWFFTGLAAFTVAMALSIFLGWAQTIGVIVLVAFAIFAFYRTNITHKANVEKMNDAVEESEEINTVDLLFEKCNSGIVKTLHTTNESYSRVIDLLIKEDFKELKKLFQSSALLEEKLNKKRANINLNIPSQATESLEASHYYVLSLDYQKEIINSIKALIEPVYSHVVNNHKPILKSQAAELTQLAESINVFIKFANDSLENNNAERLEQLSAEQEKIINQIKEARKNLIKSIKKNEIGNKASMLILSILIETRNVTIFTSNLMKIQNDFTQAMKNR